MNIAGVRVARWWAWLSHRVGGQRKELFIQHQNLNKTIQELEQSRNTLQSIIEAIPFRVFWKDKDLRYLGCNTLFARDAGLSHPRQLLGKDDYAMGWSEQADLYRTDDRQTMESQSPKLNIVEPQTSPTGTTIWLNTSKVPLKDHNGEIYGVLGVYEDITERKHTERAKEESERRYREMFDLAPVGYHELDDGGRIVRVNNTEVELLGYTVEEMVGRYVWQFLQESESSRDSVLAKLAGIKKPESKFERNYVRKDGSVVPVLCDDRMLSNAEGRISGIRTTVQDITERKRVETLLLQQARELERANTRLLAAKITAEEQAELLKEQAKELIAGQGSALEALRLKSDFVAKVSHEIRTPMNGILGMTDVLLETPLTKDQREFLGLIRQSGNELQSLINDILDLSKFEAGKLTLDIVDFDLVTTLENTVELLAPIAEEKNLELSCFVDRRIEAGMRGDPGRIRQVLINLIGNAIKFTEHGEVTVEALMENETDRSVTVCFRVTDTGIGISAENKNTVFQAFSRGSESTMRRHGGTGLGLSITRQLVQLMGGTIEVESIVDRGTTFRWTCTLEKLPSCPDGSMNSLNGLRCLVVDDNNRYRNILDHYLASWGIPSESTEDGLNALHALRGAVRDGHPYDVAILDMNMPGMNGLQLARAIKADPDLTGTQLVLLIPMGHRPHISLEKADWTAILTKPVRQSRLFECLSEIKTNVKEPRSAKTPPRDPAKESKEEETADRPNNRRLRVLVAEDDVLSRLILVRMLKQMGHDIVVTEDGEEAWEAFNTQRPEVVITDWMMPGLNGIELCKRIRSHRQDKYVYIIMLTALTGKENYLAGMNAGADDFLSKPVDINELSACLRVAERILALQLEVRQLEGLLPICMYCKSIRDEDNTWQTIENYVMHRTEATFSHGCCPTCYEKHLKPQLGQH